MPTPDPPNPTRKRSPMLSRLKSAGFDRSTYNRENGYWRPRCSQCEALVINGCPCHESGCPNIPMHKERNRDDA